MKYNVLDLFCGAGGLSLGFEMAGFNIIGGVDFDEYAIKTHSFNFKSSTDICGDITEISDRDVVKKYGAKVDLIIGGPPCQGFSAANKWQNEEEKIEKNKLFFEYMRFVKILKPKVFVIENVRQILTKDNGFARDEIYKIASEYGYDVSSKILDSSEFGVPQKRMRAFFVGVRKELENEFDFENMNRVKTKVTVKEAISDFYKLEVTENIVKHVVKANCTYQKMMRKKSGDLVHNHRINYPNAKVQERMSFVPQGGNWRYVPLNLWENQRNNRHSSAYRRLDEKVPSITIDTGHMNYFHPIYDRVPTVRESARIQSFPDNFIFKGNVGAQFRQVGNAVPPILSYKLAEVIYNVLKGIEQNEKKT